MTTATVNFPCGHQMALAAIEMFPGDQSQLARCTVKKWTHSDDEKMTVHWRVKRKRGKHAHIYSQTETHIEINEVCQRVTSMAEEQLAAVRKSFMGGVHFIDYSLTFL